jgi:hypothetical protein
MSSRAPYLRFSQVRDQCATLSFVKILPVPQGFSGESGTANIQRKSPAAQAKSPRSLGQPFAPFGDGWSTGHENEPFVDFEPTTFSVRQPVQQAKAIFFPFSTCIFWIDRLPRLLTVN